MKPKFIFLIAVFFLVGLLGPAVSFAQSTDNRQIEPTYEVVLQVLIASNTGKNTTPPALSNVIKKLKTNYSFSDYRLAMTYVERTANTVEHKGMLSEFQNQSSTTPVFSEWRLTGMKSSPDGKGSNSIQFQAFIFGARIPVVVANNTEGGKTYPIVNYESIGLTIAKFGVQENVPTILGTLSTSKPEELMFLVLTVSPANE